jgi:hypothetical protein
LPTYTGNLASLVGNVVTTANISANYLLGNITQAVGYYSNSNVKNYLNYFDGNIIPNSNAVYSLGNANNQWAELWVSNNTIYLGGLPLSVYANTTILQFAGANLISTGPNVNNTGNVTTTGNVAGNYILGNITQAIGYYSNSNVSDYIANFAGNIVTTGNITGNYILGNIELATGYSILTNTIANLSNSAYSNSNVANYLPVYTGNITAGNANVTGNVTGNYILGNGAFLTGLPQAYSNSNVAYYLPVYSGNLGNGAGYIFGNGSQLTGLNFTNYSNSNVANYLPTYTGNVSGNYF